MDATAKTMLSVAERDQLLMEWGTAKKAAEAAQDAERELRAKVVAAIWPEAPSEGTERLDLGNGYSLVGTFTVRRTLPKDERTDKMLDAIEKASEEGEFIAKRLVKFEPKLSTTEYRKLSPKLRKIVDAIMTEAPGTPQIKIEAPKGG